MKTRSFTFTAITAAACMIMLLSGCDNSKLKPEDTTPADETDTGGVTGELLISDGSDKVTGYPVTINDTVIQRPPESVICLSSSLTEVIYELGYGDKLVGRGSYCSFPESVLSLTDYGKPSSPDLEAIKASAPDLLITATTIPNKDIAALTDCGIGVLYVASPRSVDEYRRIYSALGMVFDGMFDGEQLGKNVSGKVIDKLEASGIQLGRFIYVTEGGAIAGGDTFESSVLSLFGENIAQYASGYSFSKSQLTEDQPDTVILNSDVPESELLNDSVFGSLNAVTTGKLIKVSNTYFESPSGRMTGLLDELTESGGDAGEA